MRDRTKTQWNKDHSAGNSVRLQLFANPCRSVQHGFYKSEFQVSPGLFSSVVIMKALPTCWSESNLFSRLMKVSLLCIEKTLHGHSGFHAQTVSKLLLFAVPRGKLNYHNTLFPTNYKIYFIENIEHFACMLPLKDSINKSKRFRPLLPFVASKTRFSTKVTVLCTTEPRVKA